MKFNFIFKILLTLFIFGALVAEVLAAVSWEQTNFWFRDDDGTESSATGFSLGNVGQNVNITNVFSNTAFRLRFAVKANTDAGTLNPRIEFKEGTGGCVSGTWTPVSSTSDNFALRLSSNFSDGDATTQQISTAQFTAGKILESSNPGGSVSVARNRTTEYEWSMITSASLPTDTTYTFRVTNNGTALDIYTQCPTLTSQLTAPTETNVSWNQNSFWFRDDDGSEAAATGFGADNVAVSTHLHDFDDDKYNRLKNFRLRIGFKAEQDDGTIIPQLQYREYWDRIDELTPGCGSPVGWSNLATTSSEAPFFIRASGNFADLDLTTQQIVGGTNWVPGRMLNFSNPAPLNSLLKNEGSEYEWALAYNRDFSRGVTGPNFIFRLTNNGVPLDTHMVCPLISLKRSHSGVVPPTTVIFSGIAFPGATITVIEKHPRIDVPVRKEPVVSGDGSFYIVFRGIFQSQYSYGLIIQDKEGRVTQTKAYNINTESNSLTAKDIFAPPTVDLLRGAVTKGDFIKVIGYAAPGNQVRVQLNGGIIYESIANDNGEYQLLINTARLGFGRHSLRVQQINLKTKKKSDWSLNRLFIVSKSAVISADLSGDGIINIKDWSIFLARWKNRDASIDLNNDGKADIADFGIFLRAFRK